MTLLLAPTAQATAIVFTEGVIDDGAPSSFTFSFEEPIVPDIQGQRIIVRTTLSGSFTDGDSDSQVTLTPEAPPAGISVDGDALAEIVVVSVSDNNGATWVNVGADLGTGGTLSTPGPLDSGLYGPFGVGPLIFPLSATGYNRMRVDVNFGLSGGDDLFSFNGRFDVEAVPEPGTLFLAGIGLVGFAFIHRRRLAHS